MSDQPATLPCKCPVCGEDCNAIVEATDIGIDVKTAFDPCIVEGEGGWPKTYYIHIPGR